MNKFKTTRNENFLDGSKAGIYQEGIKTQLEWIKRQLEYADFSQKYTLRYDLKRGEIYEIDWGINVNAEFSNRHFGVVMVDSDAMNPLVTVCPLKSNHGGTNSKSDIDLGCIPELGSYNTTIAVVNQVRTIDKLRLYMRRAIGVEYRNDLSDFSKKQEIHIMRLTNDKMNELTEAYKRYIMSEMINPPEIVD